MIPTIGPTEVLPGIWAANLDGARFSDTNFAVISLCRVGEPFGHPVHRMAYLADNDHNTEIDVVLDDILEDMAALRAEGRKILVHCHGGASRTGLVLRAWLRRTKGLAAQEATDAVAAKWPYLGLWNASFTAALDRSMPRSTERCRDSLRPRRWTTPRFAPPCSRFSIASRRPTPKASRLPNSTCSQLAVGA